MELEDFSRGRSSTTSDAFSAAVASPSGLLQSIRDNVLGENTLFATPFGTRRLVYCDYVASGRALNIVEDFVRDTILPLYGNTHTTSSVCGRQMGAFREEAREIIRKAVNGSKDDAVIFTGSGATSAIHLFVRALEKHPDFQKPLVLLGPYEHNSNRLIWRELDVDLICIREDTSVGGVDLAHLEEILRSSRHKLKIGSFSAASNVTGVMTDTVAVSKLLRRYGALACFDYAAAAPYLPIDMNAVDAAKDAVFISPHKFVGGVGATGILIVKKRWISSIPVVPSGGTVEFVKYKDHNYVSDIEEREEGGTPNIVGCIRAGLVFRIKDLVGTDLIVRRDLEIAERVVRKLKAHPNIWLLGSSRYERLPTFSFLIRHTDNLFLHFDFVSSLLNDIFGIQARGGCACAGPYSMKLLGIGEQDAEDLYEALRGCKSQISKTGFTRLNLSYFADESTIEFVTDALLFLADHAWRFLPLYRYDIPSRAWVWRNPSSWKDPGHASLGVFDLSPGKPAMAWGQNEAASYESTLRDAKHLLHKLASMYPSAIDDGPDETPPEIIWYLMPERALEEILNKGKALRPITIPQTMVKDRPSPRSSIATSSKASRNPFKAFVRWLRRRRLMCHKPHQTVPSERLALITTAA